MTQSNLHEDAAAIRKHFEGGTETTDKRSKILERVRAILALADDEQNHNPDAADNYRAQADQLMTAWAIEQWQVEAAQSRVNERPKPETRYMDFNWWRTSTFSNYLWDLFHDVAFHCRCVVAIRGYGENGNYGEIPVIGISSDLDYLDMLFTHLMLQMGKQLEPKPDPHLGFAQNAYTLRAAGLPRPRIAKLLYDMGIIPGTGPDSDYWDPTANDGEGDRVKYQWLAPNKEKSLRAKVRVAGEKWGRANGHDPTTTVNPKVWQRSFATGFVRGVRGKMYEIRKLREQRDGGGTPGMEIAIRDIYQQAKDLYDEMFPPPPPVELTEEEKAKMKNRKAVVRSVKYSSRAIEAGRVAGQEADVSARPGSGLRKTPELPS